MGERQVPGDPPGDNGFDEDGYDESQRAEILEVEREGPNDGRIVVDLDPDTGEDDDIFGPEGEDDLSEEDVDDDEADDDR